jgi:hypothetical protein
MTTAGTSGRLLAAVLSIVVCLPVYAAERTSRYTSLGATECAAPPPDIVRVYAARDLGVEECPAPAPYQLFVVSSDARSWVDLRRNDLIWSTEQRVVYGQDVLALGHFPNVAGSDKAEWRLDEKNEPVALIVRLRLVDAARDAMAGATISRLLVIGLSADTPCDLGLATGNEEARRLADAAPATCATTLPLSSAKPGSCGVWQQRVFAVQARNVQKWNRGFRPLRGNSNSAFRRGARGVESDR